MFFQGGLDGKVRDDVAVADEEVVCEEFAGVEVAHGVADGAGGGAEGGECEGGRGGCPFCGSGGGVLARVLEGWVVCGRMLTEGSFRSGLCGRRSRCRLLRRRCWRGTRGCIRSRVCWRGGVDSAACLL